MIPTAIGERDAWALWVVTILYFCLVVAYVGEGLRGILRHSTRITSFRNAFVLIGAITFSLRCIITLVPFRWRIFFLFLQNLGNIYLQVSVVCGVWCARAKRGEGALLEDGG